MPLQVCQVEGRRGWRWGQQGKCYVGSGAKAKAKRQGQAIETSVHNVHTPRHNPLRSDPTRTATLRRKFEEDLRRRFKRISHAVRLLVEVEDAFGLRTPRPLRRFIGNQQTVNTRWQFRTTPQQVQAFQLWLRGRLDTELLDSTTVSEDRYWQAYVNEGYEKGAGRAFDDVRKPALATGKGQLDFYRGAKREFLRSAFARPETVEKAKLLAGRVFTELEGVSGDMATRMSRTLTDGLVQGQNPVTISRTLRTDLQLGAVRAERIARTEIVRAHAEGQLDALEQLEVEQIGVMVEWDTAGDSRVCPLCRPLDGMVLKTKESHGMIPRHPNCRCAFLPANVGEPPKEQIRGKRKVEGAIGKSLRAEIPKSQKRSLETQKLLSRWAGARQKIAKKRSKPLIE